MGKRNREKPEKPQPEGERVTPFQRYWEKASKAIYENDPEANSKDVMMSIVRDWKMMKPKEKKEYFQPAVDEDTQPGKKAKVNHEQCGEPRDFVQTITSMFPNKKDK